MARSKTIAAGTAHRIISACLRTLQFCCCIIILGILGRFFHMINRINGPTDSRLVYAISIAAISVVLALVLLPPVKYSFHFFPIDFAFFIMWIVAFALLEDLSGTHTCSSSWYNGYWNIYWNSNAGNRSFVNRRGCSSWRVVLAFSFIVSFLWLLSGFLGCYACMEYHELDRRVTRTVGRFSWWKKKPKQQDLEKSAADSQDPRLLPKVGPESPTVPQI